MKQLIIAQLGHVDATSTLSDRGKDAMKHLAGSIRRLTDGLATRILSSPAIPAYESTRILAEALHCRHIAIVDCLYASPYHVPNTQVVIETILTEAERTALLIVVTHRELIHLCQHQIFQKTLGRAYPEKTLPPATAIAISLETKSVALVS